MKQKDIAIIVAAAGFSTVLAFALAIFVIGGPEKNPAKVKFIDPITSEFTPPDDQYFNQDSLNPTQTVEITPGDNQTPFKP